MCTDEMSGRAGGLKTGRNKGLKKLQLMKEEATRTIFFDKKCEIWLNLKCIGGGVPKTEWEDNMIAKLLSFFSGEGGH